MSTAIAAPTKRKVSPSAAWRDARELIWQHRYRLSLGMALMIINRLVGLVLPATSKYLIDDVVLKHKSELLIPLALAAGFATLIQAITSFSLSQILGVAAQRAITEMRKSVQEHVERLPIRYFDSTQTGVLISRIMARSQDRLQQIESSDERERQLKADVANARELYLRLAAKLHKERVRAAKKFEQSVEKGLAEVAMDNARFQVIVSDKLQLVGQSTNLQNQEGASSVESDKLKHIGHKGTDSIEFYFSANPGEELKPLARIASGGEASRLMLVLKTVANAAEFPRTIVFDEIDTGIGGRVSEAVGAKLKRLSQTNQVLCVTHQPQIARFADSHLTVQKEAAKNRTVVNVIRLDRNGRIEELARMLTGAEITDSARRHAKELLKTQI